MRRKDRLIREHEHDPYKARSKEQDSLCEDCGAVLVAGRWQVGQAPEGARRALCPACRRIRDRYPAGIVHIGGDFHRDHRDEIRNLIDSETEAAHAEHVLQRLMSVEETADGLEVTTTDPHLARRIGRALERAYEGDLRIQYGEERTLLRVWWER